MLWGDSDQLFHPDHGRTVARDIPGSEFVLIERAGHVPYLEQPEATLGAVNAFVDRHGLAGHKN